MVQFRPQTREIIAKIVYYGPPLGGKTTNLRTLYLGYPKSARGELIVVPTGSDRTIFFDFLPISAGELRGMQLRVQLYTVPGQVHYNSTRQVVLRGADGVVFVADSQRVLMRNNRDSWENLKDNLILQGVTLADLPHVIQYNKRDLDNVLSLDDMDEMLNEYNAPFYDATATQGIGVEETLQGIVKLVARSLRDRFRVGTEPPQVEPIGVRKPAPPVEVPPAALSESPAAGPARVFTFTSEPAMPPEPIHEAAPPPAPELAPPPVATPEAVAEAPFEPFGAEEPFEERLTPPPVELEIAVHEFGEEAEVEMLSDAQAAIETPFQTMPVDIMGAEVTHKVKVHAVVAETEEVPAAPAPQLAVPEAQPAAFEPEPAALEPQPAVFDAEPAALEPQPAVFDAEPAVIEPPVAVAPPALAEPFAAAAPEAIAPAFSLADPFQLFEVAAPAPPPLPVGEDDVFAVPVPVAAVAMPEPVPEPAPEPVSELVPEPVWVPEPEPVSEPQPVREAAAATATVAIHVSEEVEGDVELQPAPTAEEVAASPEAAEAAGLAIQRIVPRAIAQYGEVRELELEVPVPSVWVGGRRMTLQLRLTLVPQEE